MVIRSKKKKNIIQIVRQLTIYYLIQTQNTTRRSVTDCCAIGYQEHNSTNKDNFSKKKQIMKLQNIVIFTLASVAVASPARKFRPRPPSKVELPDSITSTEDLEAFVDGLYKKHGKKPVKDAKKIMAQIQAELDNGSTSTDDETEKIKRILSMNASKFGVSQSEASEFLDNSDDTIRSFIENVDTEEFEDIKDKKVDDVVSESIGKIENKDLQRLAKDISGTVLESIDTGDKTVEEFATDTVSDVFSLGMDWFNANVKA